MKRKIQTTYDYLDSLHPTDRDIKKNVRRGSVNTFTDLDWEDYGYPDPLDTLPIFIRSGIEEITREKDFLDYESF